MFTPITTERLTIRQFAEADLDAFIARRNQVEVARYQSWQLPYTREQALEVLSGNPPEPVNEKWWTGTVVDSASDEILGDVVTHLTWDGRIAEIGYTFFQQHWGKGYAVEAVAALVEYLFDEVGVTRVFGMLHPDNPASAMVLERNGLIFEGHTKGSFYEGDEVSDDLIYGMTRPDWEEWINRPKTPPSQVDLQPITADNWRAVIAVETHRSQQRFVATNAKSLIEAAHPHDWDGVTVVPWVRAVVADDEIVGLVMVAEPHETLSEPFLWRLLIGRLHQRRGIGQRVLDLVVDEFRSRGAATMLVSWSEGKGSPAGFYLRNGFEPTGEVEEEEIVARKQLVEIDK